MIIDPRGLYPDVDSEVSMFDGDPVPLVAHRRPDTRFPVDAFPGPYAEMVDAVAEETQTDPAMAGATLLAVLGAAAGGRAELTVRGSWWEPLCLYIAVIAESGERKSGVQRALARPLLAVEQRLIEEGAVRRREQEALRQIAVKAAEQARAIAARVDSTAEQKAEALSASELAGTLETPVVPRFLADDVTPEAAASLLAEQGGRLGILSTEGGIFDIIAGRYSNHIPNLDVWLKAYSGDPIKIDRKGRGPEYVSRPALTLGLMLQPTVLERIGTDGTFRGRGLLARFLYAEPVSKVGRRLVRGVTPAPDSVVDSYEKAVTELAHDLAGWGADPAQLRLDPAALEKVLDHAEAVEPQLGEGGALAGLRDWGSKHTGAVVRIAGLLHLARLGPTLGTRVSVDVDTVAAATRLGEYFRGQAIAAFTTMQLPEETRAAVYLLERLGTQTNKILSKRDMHRLASRFGSVRDLDRPISQLLGHGYLALIPSSTDVEARSGGRPRSPLYLLHPQVWGDGR